MDKEYVYTVSKILNIVSSYIYKENKTAIENNFYGFLEELENKDRNLFYNVCESLPKDNDYNIIERGVFTRLLYSKDYYINKLCQKMNNLLYNQDNILVVSVILGLIDSDKESDKLKLLSKYSNELPPQYIEALECISDFLEQKKSKRDKIVTLIKNCRTSYKEEV